MTASPYSASGAVLDAAAVGRTVAGFEDVGSILVDLGRTTAVPAGVAIRSSGVAAATAAVASRPGVLAGAIGFVKPTAIVISLVTAGVALLLSISGPRGDTPAVRPQQPAAELAPAGGRVGDAVSSVEPKVVEGWSVTSVPSTAARLDEGPTDRIAGASADGDSSSLVTTRAPAAVPAATAASAPTSSGAPRPVTTTTVSDGDDGGDDGGDDPGTEHDGGRGDEHDHEDDPGDGRGGEGRGENRAGNGHDIMR